MKHRRIIFAAFAATALAGVALAATGRSGPAPATQAGVLPVEISRVMSELRNGDDWYLTDAALEPDGKSLILVGRSYSLVLDAATGNQLARIDNSWGNGVALAPQFGRGFISTGQWGLIAFDLKTHREIGRLPNEVVSIHGLGKIIYDPAAKLLLAMVAGGDALVPIDPSVDLKTGKPDGEIQFAGLLRDMVADERGMVYVTVARSDKADEHVAVLDTRDLTIAANWPLPPGAVNASGISMDRVHSRLFIACNGRLLIMSATDGHEIAQLPVGNCPGGYAGSGSTAYVAGKVFASCGDGTLTVVGQNAAGIFEAQQTLSGVNGVTAMAVDPASGNLFVPTPDEARRQAPPGFKILVIKAGT